MTQFLQELSANLPAMYVGETGNLAARTTQHMTGLSDFGSAMINSSEVEWPDLDLQYLAVGSKDAEARQAPFRKTLEYISATLTVAGYTRRPG